MALNRQRQIEFGNHEPEIRNLINSLIGLLELFLVCGHKTFPRLLTQHERPTFSDALLDGAIAKQVSKKNINGTYEIYENSFCVDVFIW